MLRSFCFDLVLSVLARVKMFLPEMERANLVMQEQLQEDPSALNIEQVDEDEEHIAMV